ncbi:MAG: class I SAM-dependent methyltransferase [Moorea sp. SIO3G5]|nr:class I SAM-dependent methyltransferase [Moorena sp. SIO3G5]
MRLTIQTSLSQVFNRELNAWQKIIINHDLSLGEKLFKSWRQILGYAYNFYWRMGNECEQWIRIIMNQETKRLVSEIQPEKLNVLEISGSYWQDFDFLSYKSVAYPELDICKSRLDEKFNLIIAEQVFEHLLWPYQAGRNIYEMLNYDGYFLITTPFLIGVHHCPIDCNRWTELGLKHFLAECGFSLEQIKTGSWGNRQCLRSYANHGICEYYVKYWHSLKNEPLYPAVVWAIAHKTSK